MTPDVNVLIAAFRTDHSHHRRARAWLEQARRDCLEGRHALVLLPVVVAGFVRLVTHSRVFAEPDSMDDAIAFVDALLASPGVELGDGRDVWTLLRGKLLALGLHGDWVTDAWIAAAVEAQSEHLVTFDRDFTRLLAAHDLTLLE